MPRKKIILSPGDPVKLRSPLSRQYSVKDVDGKKIRKIVKLNRTDSISKYPVYIQKLFKRRKRRRTSKWPWKLVNLGGDMWLPISIVKYRYPDVITRDNTAYESIKTRVKDIIFEYLIELNSV